jgi:hypothetical protein
MLNNNITITKQFPKIFLESFYYESNTNQKFYMIIEVVISKFETAVFAASVIYSGSSAEKFSTTTFYYK